MLGLALGDPGSDTALPERLAVSTAVVCAVGEQRLGPELAVTARRGHTINERQQLGDVVAVCGGQRHGQRDTMPVADQVVL